MRIEILKSEMHPFICLLSKVKITWILESIWVSTLLVGVRDLKIIQTKGMRNIRFYLDFPLFVLLADVFLFPLYRSESS